jgi:hypothetical protein
MFLQEHSAVWDNHTGIQDGGAEMGRRPAGMFLWEHSWDAHHLWGSSLAPGRNAIFCVRH